MTNPITHHALSCGLQLAIERHSAAESAAVTILTPFGTAAEPDNAQGAATVLSEWLWRGTQRLDARQHSDALDRLGMQRSSSVHIYHTHIRGTLLGVHLNDGLRLLLETLRTPRFSDDAYGPAVDLSLQAIEGLKDEPQQRCMINVRRRHFPAPFNRSELGRAEDIARLNPHTCRTLYLTHLDPARCIVGLAGCVDPDAVIALLEELTADWSIDTPTSEPRETAPARHGIDHEGEDSAQVHIALAHDAPPEPHPDSILQRAAAAVLSGGMSGRLFTEVREKRSLCYSVHASYAAGRDRGAIIAYSGTTPQRAQETLDVLSAELRRIRAGVTDAELRRALVGMKSRLVMQGESTGARASAIAQDIFVRGRARTLDEAAAEVDGVTLDAVNTWLHRSPEPQFTLATVGPTALRLPQEQILRQSPQ